MESSITQYLYKKNSSKQKKFPIINFFCPAKSRGLRFLDCRDEGI